MQENIKILSEKIRDAEMVLAGIGEQFGLASAEVRVQAYHNLSLLLEGKNYFIIMTGEDQLICSSGLKEDRVVYPSEERTDDREAEEKSEAGWQRYMKWLQGTLNRKLLVLELEVGFTYPNLIRFPFEKAVFYNQKAELIRIHHKLFQLPEELKGRGISIQENAVTLFADAEL